MSGVKISIIIPIYNVEPYIERCIRSVLAQKHRPLEVVIVDDCSPDHSMSIAKRLIDAASMSGISFRDIRHDHNLGLSAARNTGIAAATGEYLYFLDSDDEITPDCIETLARPLQDDKYDFVIGNYKTTGSNKETPPLNIVGRCNNPLEAYSKKQWFPMAVNKLTNTAFIQRNALYFHEGLIHEDELWSFQVACMTKSMYAMEETTYIYHYRPGSIMMSESEEAFIEWRFRIAPMMWEYIDTHGFSENIFANNTIETFIQSAHAIFVLSKGMEGYKYYKIIRSINQRSRHIYRHLSFSSLSGFVKYAHYLMPVPLGFMFKTILRLPIQGKLACPKLVP